MMAMLADEAMGVRDWCAMLSMVITIAVVAAAKIAEWAKRGEQGNSNSSAIVVMQTEFKTLRSELSDSNDEAKLQLAILSDKLEDRTGRIFRGMSNLEVQAATQAERVDQMGKRFDEWSDEFCERLSHLEQASRTKPGVGA